jgi:hypothetical protein
MVYAVIEERVSAFKAGKAVPVLKQHTKMTCRCGTELQATLTLALDICEWLAS